MSVDYSSCKYVSGARTLASTGEPAVPPVIPMPPGVDSAAFADPALVGVIGVAGACCACSSCSALSKFSRSFDNHISFCSIFRASMKSARSCSISSRDRLNSAFSACFLSTSLALSNAYCCNNTCRSCGYSPGTCGRTLMSFVCMA